MWNLPVLRQGAEPLLSWGERREMERDQFEGMEQIYWSKDFLAEWEEYLEARERGEL